MIWIACLIFFSPFISTFFDYLGFSFRTRKLRLPLLLTSFFLVLFSAESSGQLYDHIRLDTIRTKCDSIDCPEKYTVAYRLISEDLYIPLDLRFKALDIAEKISNELADDYDLMAIHAQRGRLNLDKGLYAESLKAFHRGLRDLGKKDSKQWLEQEGWFLMGYGMLLYRVQLYPDAYKVFEDCAAVMARNKDDYGEAVALNNMALCQNNLRNYKDAEELFLKAYELRLEMDNNLLLCHSLLYLARLKQRTNELQQADSLLAQAMIYSKRVKDKNYIGDIYCEWAEMAIDDADFNKAGDYLDSARQMDNPFRDLLWLRLKTDLFKTIDLKDSLSIYLDSALVTVSDYGNLDLEIKYLGLKEELLRSIGKESEANALLPEFIQLNKKLLGLKDSLQKDMMLIQRDFIENQGRLSNLEKSNLEQELIIEQQKRTLVYVSLIVLILLTAIILFYRFYRKLQTLGRRLKLLNQRSRLAADQMTTAIMALNRNGKLIFANEAAHHHFQKFDGSKIKEGLDFLKQLRKPELKEDWNEHLKLLKERTNFQVISSRKYDDRQYYHLISLSEMKSGDKLEGMVAVLTDITSNQEKSLMLSEKTKALERANEAKDKVLSLLAHDLKEGVVGSLELARLSVEAEKPLDEQKLHMRLIFESLGRTKALLFKTLDWVKQQSQGLDLKKRPLYIQRLANDLIKEKELAINTKKVQVINNLNSELEVMADADALRAVLRNLLANAIKFISPEKGLVRFDSVSLNNEEVEISISDNGRGLSAQQVASLMGGEGLQSTQGTMGEKGTGMGLQICQDFLYSMGSTLQVRSSKDQGTVFYFKLPFKH